MKTLPRLLSTGLALALLSSTPALAQVPVFDFAHAIGGSEAASQSQMNKAVTDKAGNLYVTGIFRGSIKLGSTTLTSVGDYDVFVAKLDPAGTYQWAAQAGGNAWDISGGLAVDAQGNVHVTGYCVGNNSHFGSIPLFTPTNVFDGMGYNLFVATLSPDGQWQRAVRAGGIDINNYLLGTGIAVDAQGNAYVTGQFIGQEAHFGSTVLVNGGSYNLFVACLDANGTWRWARRGGGPGGSWGQGLATDGNGGLFLTGGYEGPTADIAGTTLNNSGFGSNGFVAKLTASTGAGQWVQQIASNGGDGCRGIAVDGQGDPYITGWVSGPAAIGALPLAKTGSDTDLFVAKFDGATGTCRWATRGGGPNNDYGTDIAVDADGTSYVTGTFVGETAGFSPTQLHAIGKSDGVVASLDAAGSWRWALSNGGIGDDYTASVAADGHGGAYVVGTLESPTATFGTTKLSATKPLTEYVTDYGFVARVADAAQRSPTPDLTLWPNPAQRGGTIWASGLAAGEPVQVFDALGRLVVADARSAYQFQGLGLPAGLSSGVYIVRSGQQTRRLVLRD